MRANDRLLLLLLPALLSTGTVRAQDAGPDGASTAAEVFRKANNAVVTVWTATGSGSGVLIDSAGIVVTNLHVVRGAEKAMVRLANGDAYDDLDVIEADPRRDLVLLKIKGFKLPSVELGDSDSLAVGHAVYAIGAPQGLEMTLSQGIVSALRDSGDGYRVIQTTAAISPGSSGGGLFDDHGRLIGITTFKIRGGENLNFALPVNYVRGIIGTTPKWTLTELKVRLTPSAPPTERADDNITVTVLTVPRLNKVYTSSGGSMAVVEQNETGIARVSFGTAAGHIFGSALLHWDEDERGFVGKGTMRTTCGVHDKRVMDAPITQEIFVVSDRVIRARWSQPVKLDCSRNQVKSYIAQEILWFAPNAK